MKPQLHPPYQRGCPVIAKPIRMVFWWTSLDYPKSQPHRLSYCRTCSLTESPLHILYIWHSNPLYPRRLTQCVRRSVVITCPVVSVDGGSFSEMTCLFSSPLRGGVGMLARAFGVTSCVTAAPLAAANVAAMADNTVTVTVAYGTTKHNLTLTGPDGKEPSLKDLSEALTEATGVPAPSQKIIFKGKSLKEMDETLSSFGIKQGCKLMMIGKRNSPEEEAELKKLKDIEKSVEQTAKKLEKVDGELTGLKNGFLAKDLQAEALNKLDQRVKVAAEQFMKILEQIDALSVPENFSDCRMKKKGLVKAVQGFLAQCDKIEAGISDHLAKIQTKNLALAE
ncbi:hypothetical protein AOLI_G00112340 [Acnodon oligacanthus]